MIQQKSKFKTKLIRVNDNKIWGYYTQGDYLGNVDGKLQKFESERAYLDYIKERCRE